MGRLAACLPAMSGVCLIIIFTRVKGRYPRGLCMKSVVVSSIMNTDYGHPRLRFIYWFINSFNVHLTENTHKT